MLDLLLLNGALLLPEIAGAAVEGATGLAASTGNHLGKSVASGVVEDLAGAADEIADIAQAAGSGLARGLVQGAVSEMGAAASTFARGFFESA